MAGVMGQNGGAGRNVVARWVGPTSFGIKDRVECNSHLPDCVAEGNGRVGSGAPLGFCAP